MTKAAYAPLAAVLQGKPPTDEVPRAAWWFLAESLAHSVAVRRSLDGVAILDGPVLRLAASRARQAAEAALDELDELDDEATGGPPADGRRTGRRRSSRMPTLRASNADLALLIVSARSTPKERLRDAIQIHLEALARAAFTP